MTKGDSLTQTLNNAVRNFLLQRRIGKPVNQEEYAFVDTIYQKLIEKSEKKVDKRKRTSSNVISELASLPNAREKALSADSIESLYDEKVDRLEGYMQNTNATIAEIEAGLSEEQKNALARIANIPKELEDMIAAGADITEYGKRAHRYYEAKRYDKIIRTLPPAKVEIYGRENIKKYFHLERLKERVARLKANISYIQSNPEDAKNIIRDDVERDYRLKERKAKRKKFYASLWLRRAENKLTALRKEYEEFKVQYASLNIPNQENIEKGHTR